MTNKEEGKMVKKGKKKAGIIAGSVVAAGIVAGGATIGILSATAKVTVNYDTGVDSITFSSDPIKKGGSVDSLPVPMRPGYKFLGWYLDADGNVPATSSTKFNKDTTLYAQWKANEYSVTLFDNVLNTHLDSATYKAAYSDNNQNTINLPILSNVYTQDGNRVLYSFRGWADETGTLVASVEQSINNVTIPYNIKLYGGSLYAVWEGTPVEVWFGETRLDAMVSLGNSVTLNQGKVGEDFNYWEVNATTEEYNWEIVGAPGAELKITSDMVSEKNGRLAVEFSANYFASGEQQTEYRVQTEIFSEREKAEEAVAGRAENYDFDAWYLDEKCTIKADLNNLPTNRGRVVLWANLTGKDVTINFDYGNAELRAGETKVPSITKQAGETILLPAYARSFAGYNVDFVAWEYNGKRISGIGGEWQVPLGVTNVTLKAIWGSSYNLLNFNLQGGILESGTIGDEYNELKTYTMPDVTVSKLGYTFVGWSESPNARPGDSDVIAKDGEYTLTQSQTTLYAVWAAKEYEIKYNLVGGALTTGNPTSAFFGNELKLANTPTRKGYNFERWEVNYIGSETPSIIQSNGSLNIGTNVVDITTTQIEITAVWSPITYNFSIDTTLGSALTADDILIEYKNDAGVVVPITYGEKVPHGSKVTLTKSALEKYDIKQWYNLIGIVPVYDESGAYVTVNHDDGAYGATEIRKNFDNDVISFEVTGDSSYQLNYKPQAVTIEYSNGKTTASTTQTSYYGATNEHATSALNFGDLFGGTVVDGKHFDYWKVVVNGTTYRFASLDSITTINSDSGTALPTLLYANNNINTLLPQDESGNVTGLTLTVEAVYRDPVTVSLRFVNGTETIYESETYDVTTRYGTTSATKNIVLGALDGFAEKHNAVEKVGYTFRGWEYDGKIYGATNEDVVSYEWTNNGNYTNIVLTLTAKFDVKEYNLVFVGQNQQQLNTNYSITVEQLNRTISTNQSSANDIYIDNANVQYYNLLGWSYTKSADENTTVGNIETRIGSVLNGNTAIAYYMAQNGQDWRTDNKVYIYAIYEEIKEEIRNVYFYANDVKASKGSTEAKGMPSGLEINLADATQSPGYKYDIDFREATYQPTRDGYTFVGWCTDSDATEESAGVTIYGTGVGQTPTLEINKDSSSTHLYAIWKANTWTVKFDTTVQTQTITFDQNAVISYVIEDTNTQEFLGWTIENPATVNSTKTTSILINADNFNSYKNLAEIVLYPILRNKVEIKVVYNLGTVGTDYILTGDSDAFENLLGEKSNNITEEGSWEFDVASVENSQQVISKTGYTLKGFARSETATQAVTSLLLTKNDAPKVTLVPIWEASTITITFNLNCEITNLPASIDVSNKYDSNTKIGELLASTAYNGLGAGTITRDGYTFMGWAESADYNDASGAGMLTTAGDRIEKHTANYSLHAVWKENFVSVEFVGGNDAVKGVMPTALRLNVKDAQATSYSARTARAGSELVSSRQVWEEDEAFSLANHNFAGWVYYTNASGELLATYEEGATEHYISVGETLSSELLSSLVAPEAVRNNKLVLTAVWKNWLTDGSNGSTDYFTSTGAIDWAKVEADGITEISLPNSIHETVLTALTADGLNINNDKITAVYLPRSIESIGEGCISSSALTKLTLPSSIARIGSGAIVSSNLNSLTISNRLVTLSGNPVKADARASEHKFAEFIVKTYENDTADNKNSYSYNYKLVNGMVLNTSGTRLFAVPQTYGATTFTCEESGLANLSSIATYAFSGVGNITSLSFSDAITSISAKAIGNMPNLTSLTLSTSTPIIQTELFDKGVTALSNIQGGVSTGLYADSTGNLYYAQSKNIVKINASATQLGLSSDFSISEYALDGLTNLTTLTLNAGTEKFANQLSQINAVVSNVTIGWEVATSASIKALSNPVSLTLGSGVTSVADNAFENAGGLSNLTLSTNLTSIGANAFKGVAITSLTLPSGVTTIGANAFYGASNLATLAMSGAETSVGDSAFANTNIQTLTIKSTINTYKNAFDETAIPNLIIETNGFTTYNNNNIPTAVKAPTSVVYQNCTTIEANAFNNCASLTSLTLNEGITTIGERAYAGTGITEVVVPHSCTTIGNYAFDGCTISKVTTGGNETSVGSNVFSSMVAQVVLYGSPEVYANAFVQTSPITSLEFRYATPKFANVSMPNCFKTVASIKFGKEVTSVEAGAFRGVSSISSITVDDESTALSTENNVLYNKDKSTLIFAIKGIAGENLTLPNSVKTISDYAFENCTGITRVTISSGLTSIGESAFDGCTALERINLPSGITTIKNKAFNNCEKLIGISIPNSVITLGESAFAGCSGATSLSIGSGIKTIEKNTFNGLSGITSVEIPNSVTTINANAFAGCSALENVKIPKSITTINAATASESPFFGCSSTITINCGATEKPAGWSDFWNNYSASGKITPVWTPTSGDCTLDGITYHYEGTTGTASVTSTTRTDDVVIPSSITFSGLTFDVTGISDNAFESSDITSVVIPDSVTSIGYYAFQGCGNLTSVTLPENITDILYNTFAYCTSLLSISIPNSVTSIGSDAFNGCTSLAEVTLGANLETIDNNAFNNCTSLTNIVIPNSVTYIGDSAFYECTVLKNVTFGSGITYIGSTAFAYCTSLTDVNLISHIETIADNAFEGCENLKSVVIPYGEIYANAFRECVNLTSVTLKRWDENNSYEGVTHIYGEAFYGCISLSSIYIPKSVTAIDDYAFDYCYENMNIYCQAYEGEMSFSDSWNYHNSYGSLNTIWGVSTYEEYLDYEFPTFDFDYNNFTFSYRIINGGAMLVDTSSATLNSDSGYIELPAVVYNPNDGGEYPLTQIGDRAFHQQSELMGVIVPDTLESIGSEAFYECSNLRFFGTSASYENWMGIGDESYGQIIIPNSVTSIGDYAFYICGSNDGYIKEITIGEGVTSIGFNAFEGLNYVNLLNFNAINCQSFYEDRFIFCYLGDSNDEGVNVVFGEKVINIPAYLFSGSSTKIVSVTIGSKVVNIYDYAFYYCEYLTDVTFGSNVVNIFDYAFAECSNLMRVELGVKVRYISGFAFENCPAAIIIDSNNPNFNIENGARYNKDKTVLLSYMGDATSFVIPDGVKTINSSAFLGNTTLTSITIPESVTTINDNAFYGCTNLTEINFNAINCEFTANYTFQDAGTAGSGITVTFGNNVTKIPDNMFMNSNANITSVIIGNSVTTIGAFAFNYCKNLANIIIPNSVTTIGNSAFANTGITEINIPAKVKTIGSSVFSNCANLTTITVDSGNTAYSAENNILFNKNKTTILQVTQNSVTGGTVTIPSTVTQIGSYAFNGLTNLNSITIPANVTSIGSYAFDGCSALSAVYTPSLNSWLNINFDTTYNRTSNPLTYAKNLYVNGQLLTNLTIPTGITAINAGAFAGCTSITSVTIPSSVTSIKNYSFEGCTALNAVYTPSLSAWLNIQFSYSSNPLNVAKNLYVGGSLLTNLVIPSGTTKISDYAFHGCTSITSVTIPGSVNSFGSNVFYNCTGLTTATLQSGLTTSGYMTFRGCTNLKTVTLADTITKIETRCFDGCKSLTSITLPSALTEIGSSAFDGTGLTQITIPDKVTKLDYRTFAYCSSLKSVYIPSSVIQIYESGTDSFYSIFDGCSSSLKVYCGASRKPSRWHSYWNYYNSTSTVNTIWGKTLAEYKAAEGLS